MSVIVVEAGIAIRLREVNVTDHPSKKSDPLIHLPEIQKLEEEIKSTFYEMRHGKVWFSEEMKREQRLAVFQAMNLG